MHKILNQFNDFDTEFNKLQQHINSVIISENEKRKKMSSKN